MRFLSLILLLAVGLGAAWGVCRFTTPRYEARCECEVAFGHQAEGGFEENLNTRLEVWRAELAGELAGAEIERVPRSRLVSVTARGASSEDVAARANAAAEALVAYTDKANASRFSKATTQISAEVERLRQADERITQKLLALRTASATDTQASERRLLEQSLAQATANILEQEKRVREAETLASFMEVARTRPGDLGAFPSSVPKESEVRRSHAAWSAARSRLANLRSKYTEEHPEVEIAKKMLVSTAKQFADVVVGSSAVADSNLTAAQNQLKAFRRTASGLRAELEGMSLRATEASGGIERLQEEKRVTREMYEEALKKENEMRVAAGQDADHVRVVRAASVPSKPVFPDSRIAYAVGGGLPVLLWILWGILWPSAPRHRHRHHHRNFHTGSTDGDLV